MEPTDTATEPGGHPPYRDHQGAHRQYIRDIVLGVNDGLVSTLLLVAGVVGGGLDADAVLIAALAAALAGAVSMATGEYIATKSQEEVFEGEMELEREHFKYHRDRELDELREWFGEMGLGPDDVERVVVALDQDDEALMRVMMALEFGVVESERRNPVLAMLSSGALFLVGAFVIGLLLGGRDPGTRSVMGLGTAQRNLAAAMLVAAQNFSSDPNVLVMVMLVAILGLILLMVVAGEMGKRSQAQAPEAQSTTVQ